MARRRIQVFEPEIIVAAFAGGEVFVFLPIAILAAPVQKTLRPVRVANTAFVRVIGRVPKLNLAIIALVLHLCWLGVMPVC